MICQIHNIADCYDMFFLCLFYRELNTILIIGSYGETSFLITMQCFKMKRLERIQILDTISLNQYFYRFLISSDYLRLKP